MATSRRTVATSALCLELLLLAARGLLCSAQDFVQCMPGDYDKQLGKRRNVEVMDEDEDSDTQCCNASHWVVDGKSGTLGVFLQLPSAPDVVKHLVLEKWHVDKWILYTEEFFLREDYNRSGDKPPADSFLYRDYASEKCGYYTFGYISSGFYRLSPCESSNTLQVTTDFDESKLNCTLAKHSSQIKEWSKNDSTFTERISYDQQLTRKMDRLYVMKDSNNTVVTEWFVRARRKDSERLICENNDNRVKYNPDPETALHGQTFLVDKLLPGNYTVEIRIFGQLSALKGKLNKCRRRFRIKISENARPPQSYPSAARNPSAKENVVVMSMVTLAAAAVLCSFCYLIYRILGRGHHPDPEQVVADNETEDLTRKKVLLLYARDCPQFNDVMAAFRDLLKKNNFEVYDCYDPVHRRQVDKSPTLWMRYLVEDSSVRVVVVSSKCARFQQLALMSGGKFSYKEPHYLDRLFIYGLSDTMGIHKNIYQKIFSVTLEGFTQNEDILSILGGSRRYSLPTHLLELFRDLRYNSKTPEETPELRLQVATLKEKLNVLARHANTKRDYLSSTVLTF